MFLVHIFRILKIVLIAVGIVFVTKFGWRPTPSYEIPPEAKTIAASLEKSVRVLSERIGDRSYFRYQKLQDAADFIERSFHGAGYRPQRWSYLFEGRMYHNIVASTSGEALPDETIVVGAHYDTFFNPGADDNASGVAGVIELARLLKDEQLSVPIMFVGFVNEEPPFYNMNIMGSRVLARSLKNAGVLVRAAVVLEMIGYYSEKPFSQTYLPFLGPFYPNQGDFIAIVGNFPSRNIIDLLQEQYKMTRYFPAASIAVPESMPHTSYSDHASFWEMGYRAVMVTDTAYLRNPHYHRLSDLADTLDYHKMAAVIMGLKEGLLKLAQPGGIGTDGAESFKAGSP